jgi:hypothetical protein
MPWRAKDRVMAILEALPDPIGPLAGAFPGETEAASDPGWINEWFIQQTTRYATGTPPDRPQLTISQASPEVLDPLRKPQSSASVRIVSIRPHYFRGFRRSERAIRIAEDLVVVEGPNSSGKTSLSEAIEWLLTGALSRRQSGNPKELANCIANQFCPPDDSTWVEGVLNIDGVECILKRVLVEDYTEIAASAAKSILYRDGVEIKTEEERDLLANLFAGIPPILMQHTLRDFVHKSPADRRRYFEQLLEIDQLTAFIERAVVGDARLRDFPCPTAPDARQLLDSLAKHCSSQTSRKAIRALERAGAGAGRILPEKLVDIAAEEFGLDKAGLETAMRTIRRLQQDARERQFPPLQRLRITDPAIPNPAAWAASMSELRSSTRSLDEAVKAANRVSRTDRIVSEAVVELVAAGVLAPEADVSHVCPLCLAPDRTLQPHRIQELIALQPAAVVLAEARQRSDLAKERYTVETARLKSTLSPLDLGEIRASEEQLHALPADIRSKAEAAIRTAASLRQAVDDALRRISDEPTDLVAADAQEVEVLIARVKGNLQEHLDAVAALERGLGADALRDPKYAAREAWLAAASNLTPLADHFRWQAALKQAQELLRNIRQSLIDLRGEIIEGARRAFSQSMAEVWDLLRSDPAGRFAQITIPPVSGKGYKLEFEVKASLNDGSQEAEVDALRVFSESQINVIGIAAFVTRSAALGHTILIFDDPVQSMDEEYFQSLAGRLVSKLIEDGKQVIIFTHSYEFARKLSHAHYARESYATLEARYSRRMGCVLGDGNRRVAERLKAAERLAEEGQLSEAWRRVRLAIERLYVLATKAADPSFDPDTWRSATAEYMWNAGAGQVIETRVQGSGQRLKNIVAMTVKGAHDVAATSVTDVLDAVKYLRTLLDPLRVGSG